MVNSNILLNEVLNQSTITIPSLDIVNKPIDENATYVLEVEQFIPEQCKKECEPFTKIMVNIMDNNS